jgi:hypothetical protein
MTQRDGSEVVKIDDGCAQIPTVLRPRLIDKLGSAFPGKPFFIRLDPNRFYTQSHRHGCRKL